MTMDGLNRLLLWGRHLVCELTTPGTGMATSCDALGAQAPSPTAVWMLLFGLWMMLLGSIFILVPALGGSRLQGRIRQLANTVGFPEETGVWSTLFGVAIASFG